MVFYIFIVVGYIAGSIPFAYVISRFKGVNVLDEGTGIPGTANVYRLVGPTAGVAVLVLDMAKAALPVAVARWLGVTEWQALLVGLVAMAGHWFPLFLRFRGGAGIASAIGVALGLMPIATLVGLAAGLLVVRIFRSTGHATAVGASVLLTAAQILDRPLALAIAIASLTVLVALKRYTQVLYERLTGKSNSQRKGE